MAGVQRGGTATRALLASVIGMGVLIVLGVAFLAVTVVRRMSNAVPTAPHLALDEPPGTRMVGVSAVGDRIVILLQGGGPDRLVLLDARSGLSVGQVVLREAEP